MAPKYVSPAMRFFTAVRLEGAWRVGAVTALQGRTAVRVSHVCLQLRDSSEEALQDACDDAENLLLIWSEKVPI